MKKPKRIDIVEIRGLSRDSDEVAAIDLMAEGYGLFSVAEEDKPALVLLALSDKATDKAEFVRLIDEHASDVRQEAVAILNRGQTPAVLEPRMISLRTSSGYLLVSGLLTVLAQLYNHCKLGTLACVFANIEKFKG